ncbi:MAG: VOC family protein [Bacteroidetes bacterium]|nr:VOC family protein [Bacteroidota bacterium]
MNTIAYFEIQSSNPEREVMFYEKLFGWKFEKVEGIPIEYYRITTKTINGGLLKRPAAVPPAEHGTNAYTCSVEVDNFDRVSELIIKNGGTIAMPKFAIPGTCWQGYFIDPDYNTFGIIEIDKNAK